ncbi:glycosyltransferase [Bosea sp. 124]|uniref:glycosyltransferase n=1 Tax=Bosea sp. 124 TaxID=2135642 RepID=UPI000D38C1B8|nr:glycosyltransferase [Bosea sp. 124]PTM41727.1 glycosyltransferase involved in cell wall biosynthesis [Bosea sp. 124]
MTQRCATFVCDWLPPAFGAVGQYMLPVAQRAAAEGADVVLIGLGRERVGDEDQPIGNGRLRIIRIDASATPRKGLLTRGLWAMRINLRLIRETHRALWNRGRGDLMVTGSPPFLSSLMILLNRLLWRQRLVYRITDFYPEIVLASGQANWLRFLAPLFKAIRGLADEIEVLGRDQERRLREYGVPQEKIRLLRDGSPVAIAPDLAPLASPFSPGSRILLYSGNLGVAHPIAALCEAYRRHVQSGSNRVRLWVNGIGARLPELVAYCKAHDLPLHLSGPVPLDQLGRLLVTADAHLILLGEAYWGYALPSKVYGCLASGKPILFIGPEDSDVALLMQESGDPRHVQTLDAEDCYRALQALADAEVPESAEKNADYDVA